MKYSLRSLMVMATVAPPLLAMIWIYLALVVMSFGFSALYVVAHFCQYP